LGTEEIPDAHPESLKPRSVWQEVLDLEVLPPLAEVEAEASRRSSPPPNISCTRLSAKERLSAGDGQRLPTEPGVGELRRRRGREGVQQGDKVDPDPLERRERPGLPALARAKER